MNGLVSFEQVWYTDKFHFRPAIIDKFEKIQGKMKPLDETQLGFETIIVWVTVHWRPNSKAQTLQNGQTQSNKSSAVEKT